MKVQVKVPEHVATMMAICYNNIAAAKVLAQEIFKDNQTPSAVKYHFLNIAASLQMQINRIEKHVPDCKKEAFKEQISEGDPLAFDNVKRLWFKLRADQKDTFERAMAYAIKSGSEVNIIDEP